MFSYSLKCSRTSFLYHLRSIFFVFHILDFIVLFYALFRTFLVVQIFFNVFLDFHVFSYSSNYVQPQASIRGDSSQVTQVHLGHHFQGLFYPFDISLECFHSQEACDCFYAHFQSHRIEVERSIDLCAFQDTHLPSILKERVRVLVYLTWFILSSSSSHVLCKHAYYFSWLLHLGDHVWSVISNHLIVSQACTRHAQT